MSKITLDQEGFKVLKNLVKFVPKKSTLPILYCLKAEITEQNKLKVYASDSNICIEKEIVPKSIELGTGRTFVIPSDLIKSTKIGKKTSLFTFELRDQFMLRLIVDGVCESRQSYDPEIYPEFPELGELETLIAVRYDTLEKLDSSTITVFSEESRPILKEIHLLNNQIIATDSHRLFQAEHNGNVVEELDAVVSPALIKAALACEAKENFFGVLKRSKNTGFMVIQTLDTTYFMKPYDGNYPQTDRLIPAEFNTVIMVDQVEKIQQIFTSCDKINKGTRNRVVRLTLKEGELNISASSEDTTSKVEETMPVRVEKDTGDFKIAFSTKYILDAIKQLGDTNKLTFNFMGPMRPFTITGDQTDRLALVLPVRIF